MKNKPDDSDYGFGIKFTRNDKYLIEDEDHFMEGLLGTPTLIGGALTWLIIASLFNFGSNPWHNIAFGISIGIASVMVLVWYIVHALPGTLRFLKKVGNGVVDWVCKPIDEMTKYYKKKVANLKKLKGL